MLTFDIFCLGEKRVPQCTEKLPIHMSILHMCNANAVSLPPLYVFAGVKLIHNMLAGAPQGNLHAQKKLNAMRIFICTHHIVSCHVGAAMAFQSNGSFVSHLFVDVIRHLVAHKHAGPALLIIDGHNSHHEVDALDL
jgi:hypothetical protein